MTNRSIQRYVLLFIAFAVSVSGLRAQGIVIVDGPNQSFTTNEPGACVIPKSVKIVNPTDSDIYINDIQTSCSCLVSKTTKLPLLLPARSSSAIDLEMSLATHELNRKATLLAEDSTNNIHKIELTLVRQVTVRAILPPDPLSFSSEDKVEHFVVLYHGKRQIVLPTVTLGSEILSGSIVYDTQRNSPANPDHEFYLVSIRDNSSNGEFVGAVTFEVARQGYPSLKGELNFTKNDRSKLSSGVVTMSEVSSNVFVARLPISIEQRNTVTEIISEKITSEIDVEFSEEFGQLLLKLHPNSVISKADGTILEMEVVVVFKDGTKEHLLLMGIGKQSEIGKQAHADR